MKFYTKVWKDTYMEYDVTPFRNLWPEEGAQVLVVYMSVVAVIIALLAHINAYY